MVTGYGGSYRGSVVDNADPTHDSRLLVLVPEVYGDSPVWALASLSAGGGSSLPSVGDMVWVTFEHGDTDYPVWQLDEGAAALDNGDRGLPGKYRAIVVDNVDPYDEDRLQVNVPQVDSTPSWAVRGDGQDHGDVPDIGAEVWVEYEYGDPAYPRWVGIA